MAAGTSPFSLIDGDVFGAFKNFADLSAIVPTMRYADRVIEATDTARARVLGPALELKPLDVSIEPDKGSQRMMKIVMPYEVRVYASRADLPFYRDVSYQALRAVLVLGNLLTPAGVPLVPRLPLAIVSVPLRGVAIPADSDTPKAYRAVMRFDVICNSTMDTVLIQPILFEAIYATGPNRIILTYIGSDELDIVLTAFTETMETGVSFSAKDSGGNPIPISGASATGGNNAVTITLSTGAVPSVVSYSGTRQSVKSLVGAVAEAFTDQDIANT